MSGTGCERAKDLLPLWARDELSADEHRMVDEHLATCRDCRVEAELVRALLASAPLAPEGLEARIRSSIAGAPLRSRVWLSPRLAAAAVVVLALGTAVIWQQRPGEDVVFAEEPLALTWPSDDGFIAGVAMLEDLSDEALAELLEELGG